MNRLTREWTAEPVPQDQILRRERGQRNIHVSCSVDHQQEWQPNPVDPYSCYKCDYTTYTNVKTRPLCGDRLSKRMLFLNDFASFFFNDQILRVIDYTLYEIKKNVVDNLTDRYDRPWLCSSR